MLTISAYNFSGKVSVGSSSLQARLICRVAGSASPAEQQVNCNSARCRILRTITIGNSVVLDQIQLTVKPGEMIGLQGVNGSGKTMLLRLISGLIYPTKGHVLIDGKMLGSDLEFPPSIGFLIENPTFLPQYTGAENLQMLSSLHQMMPTAQIESVLQRVGLHDTKYKKYSLGMKQRLGIAAAVFEQPDIILLDEPTNALDESGITMLENVIQDETSRGATIVMASHDMNFLHHCCSKIYTMRAGTLSL